MASLKEAHGGAFYEGDGEISPLWITCGKAKRPSVTRVFGKNHEEFTMRATLRGSRPRLALTLFMPTACRLFSPQARLPVCKSPAKALQRALESPADPRKIPVNRAIRRL